MDGYEATRQIRRLEKTLGTKQVIIGLSAGASADERDAALSAGMDDYLIKPVRRDALENVIKKSGAINL